MYFNQFIEELFNTQTKEEAFEMIQQARPFLTSLEGARLQGGPAQNTFTNLFDVEEITTAEEVDLENPDDDELRALEQGLNDE